MLWTRMVRFVASLTLLAAFIGTASAATIFEQAAANSQQMAEAVSNKDFKRALELALENQKLVPDYWDYVRQEAWVFWQWGNDVVATQGYEAARPYYERARIRYQDAIAMAEDSGADPTYLAAMWQQLGHLIGFHMDDYEYGVRALERAIMYDPMHPKSYYFLATLVQNTHVARGTMTPEVEKYVMSLHRRAVELNGKGEYNIYWSYYNVAYDEYINNGDIDYQIWLLEMFLWQIEALRNGNYSEVERLLVDDAMETIELLRAAR